MAEAVAHHWLDWVRTRGTVPFSDYMQEALYGVHGYYTEAVRIGSGGADFFTASQFPLFGYTVARYIEQKWEARHCPASFQVIELGAGQGELAGYVTEALAWGVMRNVRVEYVIVDVSPRLVGVQAERLANLPPDCVRVRWGNPNPNVPSVLLANEVLDALPVDLLRREKHGWQRALVTVKGESLVLAWERANSNLADLADAWLPIPMGTQAELCSVLPDFFRQCAGFAKEMSALFPDYGITLDELRAGARPQGTVRSYLQHQLVSPLTHPGAADITADVHWSHALHAAEMAGFTVNGLKSQGSCLLEYGIADVMQSRWQPTDAPAWERAARQFKQLVLPGGMGERFSVLECEERETCCVNSR